MASMKFLLAFTLLICFVASAASTSKVTIRNVDRVIDLTSQLARHTVTISFLNGGAEPLQEFEYTVQTPLAGKLAWISAQEGSTNVRVSEATPTTGPNGEKYVVYRIRLNRPLESQATSTLKVTSIYTRTMTPYPVSIRQNDGQLVRYRDNHYFFSPYTVLSQDTKVQLPSVKVAAYSKQKPALLKGDRITYGPYVDVAPFTHSNMTVHFENNSPFTVITSLVKEYEISQWGNLAVEETYQIVHEGARFTGAFNRFEYQRLGAPSSVNNILRTLPPSANDIYYRDVIGNISTSHVSTNKDGTVKLELTPRFPLFGGWNIGFYLGFNLPLSNFLFSSQDDSSQLVLNVTFAINTPSLVIDDYTLRIILPEGASDIKPVIPFSVDEISNDSHFTYLDYSGRPVLVIKKRNVVNEHDQSILVLYRFSKTSMLQEPILLITAIFVFLLSFILITRIDLSVTYKEPVATKQYSTKVKELLVRIPKNQDKREEVYETYEAASSAAKNHTGLEEARAKAEASLKVLDNELVKLASDLSKLTGDAQGAALAEVVKEVVNLEKERFSHRYKAVEAGKKNPKAYDTHTQSLAKVQEDVNKLYTKLEVD